MKQQVEESHLVEFAELPDGEAGMIKSTMKPLAGKVSAAVDAKEFMRKVDDYIKGMVAIMLEERHVQEKVDKHLDRSIEVACKTLNGNIQLMIQRACEDRIRKIVAEAFASMHLRVSVSGADVDIKA